MPLAEAVKTAGIALARQSCRWPPAGSRSRLQNGQVPAPLRLLFSLGQGKSRMLPDPGGRGFYVVKTNTIIPGNALLAAGTDQPDADASCRRACREEYAQQFQAAMRAEMKAQRNESAIAAEKARLRLERRLISPTALDRSGFVAYTFPVRSFWGVTADAHRQAA